MVSLYIENQLIELDKEVQFAITKTFEDISNPTSIINDWSKTVSIPFTDKNNETFGHIYNPDRITIHDEDLTTGLYFDPLKKLDFRLEWDSAVLMTGYAKMTSVTKTNGTGRYNITLNGELGKLFQEMKKITFDETKYVGEDKDKYWIDGSKYVDSIMNINSFINSNSSGFWQSAPMYSEKPEKNKCINFTLNNGFSKGFDFTTFEKNSDGVHSIMKFTDVLSNINFATETGIEPDDVIKEGLKPREIGEYRTYLQHPFIYLHQLFYIFKDKFESISDYKVDFDNNWFNKYNPYWSKLIFMLKNLSISDNADFANNYYKTELTNNSSIVWQAKNPSNIPVVTPTTTKIDYTVKLLNNGSEESTQIVDWSKNPPLFQLSKLISFYTTYNLRLRFHRREQKVGRHMKIRNVEISNKQGLNLNLYFRFYKFLNGVKTLINTKTTEYFVCSKDYKNTLPNKTIIYTGLSKTIVSGGWSDAIDIIDIPVPITASLNENNNIDPDTFVEIDFDANWQTDDYIFTSNYIVSSNLNPWEEVQTWANIYLEATDDYLISNIIEESSRTGRKYSLNDIWESKNELFDEIIRYCKIFRINVIVDEYNKTIKFIQSKDFFQNIAIEDWTDKLDTSKTIDIVPITFENKYILFNYENDNSVLNKEYNTKTGLNYGEYKLATDYNFNTDTKQLFNGAKTSINYTPHIISWTNLYDNKKIVYSFPNEIYLYDYDKDEIDLFGRYFFYNQLIKFDQNEALNLRNVNLSDDTEYQVINNIYCYTQDSDLNKKVRVEKFPLCTVVEGDNCCLFNIPSENYTFNSSLFDNKKSIFYNVWQNYLDERYNTNNKIVTCYLDISPTDYMNFEFNKFIKIENQLYMVNKIYDYDITSNSTTKVDLITIQDITGYTTNNFTIDYFEVFYNKGEVFDDRYHYIDLYKEDNEHTIYISSSSDVDWDITNVNYGDYDKVTINGVSGETGTIKKGMEVPVKFVNNYGTASFDVTFTNKQGRSIVIAVVAVSADSFIVKKSDGAEAFDYETISINTSKEQSTTLYVTSTEAPVKVSIVDITNGALEDITINGVNARDIWENYSEIEIPIGTEQPLTISGVAGADFSIDIELNNNKQLKIFKIVSVW